MPTGTGRTGYQSSEMDSSISPKAYNINRLNIYLCVLSWTDPGFDFCGFGVKGGDAIPDWLDWVS